MTNLIRLLDLPGVAELEAALHVPGRQLDKQYDDLDERIQALSLKLFGITDADTQFAPRPDEQVWDRQLETHLLTPDGSKRWDAWEANFEFLQWEWEEEDAFWALGGLDVRGEDGESIEILANFGRQIVCAIKGLHPRAHLPGKAPAQAAATDETVRDDAERWGQRLAEEARQFKPKR